MNDERLDKIIKLKLKQDIKIPSDLYKIVNKNINNSGKKSKTKSKIILTKIIQIIATLTTLFTISGIAYATVTGNSILSLLGLGIAGMNYDTSSIIINKTIKNENLSVNLNRIACDNTFLILEYDINFTKTGIEKINLVKNEGKSEPYIIELCDDSEALAPESLELVGGIIVNGAKTKEFKSYTEKISDNEYKLFHIILMDTNSTNLMITIGAYYLQYSNVNIYFDDPYCFYIDLNLINNNMFTSSNTKDIHAKSKNTTITVNSLVDSKIATVGKVNIELSELSNTEENATDITFNALDSNQNKLNIETVFLKKIIKTENDEEIDLINNDYTEATDGTTIEYNNGTANIELLLLFKDGINQSDSITLIPFRNGKKMNDGFNVKVTNQKNNNIKINSVTIDTNYSELSQKYSTLIYDAGKLENPYYSENAPKISLENFEINGLKLGMSIEDSMNKLQEVYNKIGYNIKCRDFLSEIENNTYCYYNDESIQLDFYSDSEGSISLVSINLYNGPAWEKYGMTEKQFISNYYSNKYYDIFNQVVYKYKILYGTEYVKAKFNGKTLDGDYAYIFLENSRDYFIEYYSNNISLNFAIDATTKKITSIGLSKENF